MGFWQDVKDVLRKGIAEDNGGAAKTLQLQAEGDDFVTVVYPGDPGGDLRIKHVERTIVAVDQTLTRGTTAVTNSHQTDLMDGARFEGVFESNVRKMLGDFVVAVERQR